MSTLAGDSLEPTIEEGYPLALLKNLLKQMLLQFSAQGACLALYDERVGQMRVQLHVRLRTTARKSWLRRHSPQASLNGTPGE